MMGLLALLTLQVDRTLSHFYCVFKFSTGSAPCSHLHPGQTRANQRSITALHAFTPLATITGICTLE